AGESNPLPALLHVMPSHKPSARAVAISLCRGASENMGWSRLGASRALWDFWFGQHGDKCRGYKCVKAVSEEHGDIAPWLHQVTPSGDPRGRVLPRSRRAPGAHRSRLG